jgi:hexulose-6-phosphate isomerase
MKMNAQPNRRELLAGAAAAITLAGTVTAVAKDEKPEPGGKPKKALLWGMLPGSLQPVDRFKLAKDVGFEGVEMPPITDPAQCEAMRKASEQAGIRIHSVIYGGWDPPLTHPDPAKREQSIKNAEAALNGAHLMGADGILLVPGVVNAETPYKDAYERARAGIRRLAPLAESLKTQINLEEVWNNFLLSPMEFGAFVDSFKSKWINAYFDVGNVVPFAWPEDWVRTLGPRIKKVHLKDFKGGPGLFGGIKGNFCALREGSIKWPEVRKAFNEIGYDGFMTTELGGGDEAYLRDVSARVDKILAGE